MASSVLALTMATLLKGNAAASDASSAAEKGLIKSRFSKSSATARDTKRGKDELIQSSKAVRESSACAASNDGGSPAPSIQRMSRLQRMFSRSQRGSAASDAAPADAEAESVRGPGIEDNHVGVAASDDTAAAAPAAPGRLASLLTRISSRALRRSSVAPLAATGVADGGTAPADAANAGDVGGTGNSGSADDSDSEAASVSNGACTPDADSSDRACAPSAAEAAQVLQTPHSRMRRSSAESPAPVSAERGTDDQIDGGHSAGPAWVTPPQQPVMERSPPQQRTQRATAVPTTQTARVLAPQAVPQGLATAHETLRANTRQVLRRH